MCGDFHRYHQITVTHWITLPLVIIGLSVTYFSDAKADLFLHIGAAAFGYLLFWSVTKLYARFRGREGLGLGDAKLLAAVGAWLGPWYLAPVVLVSSILGLLYVLCLHWRRKGVTMALVLPFGPFLGMAFFGFWCAREFGGLSLIP